MTFRYKIIALFGPAGSGKDYIVKNIMKAGADECVGFVSLAKAKNSNVYDPTTNKNGKKGIKRIPLNKSTETKNLSSSNYDKNDDFEYYCIIQEDKEQKIYQIPCQLCYWREHLIDTKSQKDPTKTLSTELRKLYFHCKYLEL